MGFLLVSIVGAVAGWLVTIMSLGPMRRSGAVLAVAGAIGALISAVIVGGVSLAVGVSAHQLLWSVGGALLAIVCVGFYGTSRDRATQPNN